MQSRLLTSFFLLIALVSQASLTAQEFTERFDDWPVDLTIEGRLILAGSVPSLDAIEGLVGRESSSASLVIYADDQGQLGEQYAEFFNDVDAVDSPYSLLDAVGSDAVIAWHQSEDSPGSLGFLQSMLARLRRHMESGGTLILVGQPAAWSGTLVKAYPQDWTQWKSGPGLLPDALVQLDFQPATEQARLLKALELRPGNVGVGLENGMALALDGRKLWCAGPGKLTIVVRGGAQVEAIQKDLLPRTRDNQMPSWLADWTQWRRIAIDQTLEPFPAASRIVPQVSGGQLFIVGGGGVPNGLMQEFVQAAGGHKDARLVYVPCSERRQVSDDQRILREWQEMGVSSVTMIHTKDRLQAHSDPEFYAPLEAATGIWFGGGRQWNFSDSYYGTTTHQLMRQVLARGGVIGGSSAGASIQAAYLARATPIQNFEPMAPGYERGGLGFIQGVAIDQHFAQRNRFQDLERLVKRHPQLLGIGIDETTALVVQGHAARVIGRGQVHLYDCGETCDPRDLKTKKYAAGDVIDLRSPLGASGIENSE